MAPHIMRQTDDLELKKLVYLYCQNYAKTQPDLAIMAVNTFVKDSQVHMDGGWGGARPGHHGGQYLCQGLTGAHGWRGGVEGLS